MANTSSYAYDLFHSCVADSLLKSAEYRECLQMICGVGDIGHKIFLLHICGKTITIQKTYSEL